MTFKRNKHYKKEFKYVNIYDNRTPLKKFLANFNEYFFWTSQILIVLTEYAVVIALFVLMLKTVLSDDYNDPYYKELLSDDTRRSYAIGFLALKFIMFVKSFFV